MRRATVVLLVIATVLQGACVTGERVRGAVRSLQPGPVSPPTKTITNFTDGLTCMDDLLLDYELPETTFLIEGLTDNTGKVNSGTRDMLITALATMSRRSNAIRVVSYDFDTGNAVAFMERAKGSQIYSRVPKFDIRGSISQYDSRVASDRVNAAFTTEKWGLGGDRRVSGDVLGVDLSVIRTKDLSVIPSATSSNQVIITNSDGSGDGDAIIKKSAIYFNFALDRAEGPAQAVRNLLDLAAIELIGRLLKVPYWQCLGISADSEAVRREVSDWMLSYERDGVFIPYVRRVLYVKGFYDVHASDSTLAFQRAVRAYQQYAGLNQDGVVDHDFVMALYEGAGNAEVPAASVAVERPPEAPDAAGLAVTLTALPVPSDSTTQLAIALNDPGYVHCYFQGEEGHIQRVFPNRFAHDNHLAAGQTLQLPGAMPFELHVEAGRHESVICFATRVPVAERLPMHLRADDFSTLPATSLTDLRAGFLRTAAGPVAESAYRGAAATVTARNDDSQEAYDVQSTH